MGRAARSACVVGFLFLVPWLPAGLIPIMDEFEARSMLIMANTGAGDFAVVDAGGNRYIVFVCDGRGDLVELVVHSTSDGRFLCVTPTAPFAAQWGKHPTLCVLDRRYTGAA